MAVIRTDSIHYENIGTRLREKLGTDKEFYPAEMADGVAAVYDAGVQAEYDRFWDAIQGSNGQQTSYIACFGGVFWNANTLKPKWDIVPRSNASYMFYYNQMGGDLVAYFESIGKRLDLETPKCNFNSTFQYSKFTRLPKMYNSEASWYSTFANCSNLVTIDEIGHKDGGEFQLATSTFSSCPALRNVKIKGTLITATNLSTCPLSKDSIIAFMTCLSDRVTGKTLTLKKSAVNIEFETSAGANDGVASDEWKALVAAKTNWTISLV